MNTMARVTEHSADASCNRLASDEKAHTVMVPCCWHASRKDLHSSNPNSSQHLFQVLTCKMRRECIWVGVRLKPHQLLTIHTRVKTCLQIRAHAARLLQYVPAAVTIMHTCV